MAPPKHMPVPMRCTKSTARMVARDGRPSMLKRLRRPKAARTKATRRDSRRELMDYHLLTVVDEESERYVAQRRNGGCRDFLDIASDQAAGTKKAPRRRAARSNSTTTAVVGAITSNELSGPNIPPVSQSGPARRLSSGANLRQSSMPESGTPLSRMVKIHAA